MRILIVGVLSVGVAGCPDKAPVAATVVHIEVSGSGADCGATRCTPSSFEYYCGAYADTRISPSTTSIEVSSDYDANEIDRYVQVQYDNVGNASVHEDYLLRGDDSAPIASAYRGDALYFVDTAGEPVAIEAETLVNRDGSTLTFAYEAANGGPVVEVHHIDDSRFVNVETNVPEPFSDACCSAARPQDGALVVLVLVGVLGRARRLQRLRW